MTDDIEVRAKQIKDDAIKVGYLPESCIISEFVVFAFLAKEVDPCSGCNIDRNKCKGRPRK